MTNSDKTIKNKLGLLKLSETLGNVYLKHVRSWATPATVFIGLKSLYDKGGDLALQEISRRKSIVKNRVKDHIEKAVIEMVIEKPAFG